MTTTARPELHLLTCPLHGTRRCLCTRSSIEPADLGQPFAIGLWECADGHLTVGGPTPNPGRYGGVDLCPCKAPLIRRHSTTIVHR